MTAGAETNKSTAIPARPPRPPLFPENVPSDLAKRKQWVGWSYQRRDADSVTWTKAPLQADGSPATHSNPSTWNNFSNILEACERHGWDGIGFVVAQDDNFAVADLDSCVDLQTGVIAEWALQIIRSLDSYTEISPSGTGVRIIVRGELPRDAPPGKHEREGFGADGTGTLKIYDKFRVLTTTGRHLPDTPPTINRRRTELDDLYLEHFYWPELRRGETEQRSIAVVRFDHKEDVVPKPTRMTWDELRTLLSEHKPQAAKDGPGWSPVEYAPGTTRRLSNVVSVHALVLDFDNGIAPGPLTKDWAARGLEYHVHSSYSHQLQYPKWRVAFPLKNPIPADRWKKVYPRLAAALGQGHEDASCKDASRFYYLPSCDPAHESEVFTLSHAGKWLDPDDGTFPEPEEPKPAKTHGKSTRREVSAGTGDYATLDVRAWFAAHGLYGYECEHGKHFVACPWEHEHTEQTAHPEMDGDTTVWDSDGQELWPQFHCLHAHCQGRSIQDVMDLWGDADRYCARDFPKARMFSVGDEPEPAPVDREALVQAAKDASEADRENILHTLAGTLTQESNITIDRWAGRVAREKLIAKGRFLKAVGELQKAERAAAAAQRPAPDREGEPIPYRVVNGRICQQKEVQVGDDWKTVFTALCNFDARITAEEIRDDGAERKAIFTLAGNDAAGQELAPVQVPAERFPSMGWVVGAWGNRAVVLAGRNTQDHLRTAIQLLSQDVPRRTVYGHMGWRLLDEGWAYLHRDGAIGANGAVPGIEVLLEGALRHYALPDPPEGEALQVAIRRSLALLHLAPVKITYPLLAATYRAPLCEMVTANLSLFLAGQSGSQKSAMSALAQAHFGPAFRGDVFPENWSTSENTLEHAAFLAKDALFFVDDFVPRGTVLDVQQLQRKADRLFRGQANQAGRGRMRADGSRRPTYYPRGLVAGSGEEEPSGVSVKARLILLELTRGDVDLERLTEAQQDSAAGILAQSMAGYVQWLAPQIEMLRGQLGERQQALRSVARSMPTQHDRTPDNAASLALGLEMFLRYAVDVGALTQNELQAHWRAGWDALMGSASNQAAYQENDDPASRFLALLSSALISGAAHVANIKNGKQPEHPTWWGWRSRESGWGDFYHQAWQPLGPLVGWLDGENLFLLPDAVFKVAQEFSRGQGAPLVISQIALWKLLKARGLLASREEKRDTLKVRKSTPAGRLPVLHLRVGSLTGSTAELSDQLPWESRETSPDGQETAGAAA